MVQTHLGTYHCDGIPKLPDLVVQFGAKSNHPNICFSPKLSNNGDLVHPKISLKVLTTYSLAQVQGQSVEDYMVQAQDRTKNAKAKSELAAFTMWKEQLQHDQCKFEAARIMSLLLV